MFLLESFILIFIISIYLAPTLIQSAVFLIFTFFFSAVWLSFAGAELLSLLFILVYIGAIAVLFIFVIMLIHAAKNQIQLFRFDDTVTFTYDYFCGLIMFIVIAFVIYIISSAIFFSFPFTYSFGQTYNDTLFATMLFYNSNIYILINSYIKFFIKYTIS